MSPLRPLNYRLDYLCLVAVAAGKYFRRYIAYVQGVLRPKKGVFEGKIIDKAGKRFGEKPKPAKSFYKTLRVCGDFSVVELIPVTGRTNQLRIQLSNAGHPILGEDQYAFRRDHAVKFKRLALHAFYLEFSHPVGGGRIKLKIGLPRDMSDFIGQYRDTGRNNGIKV